MVSGEVVAVAVVAVEEGDTAEASGRNYFINDKWFCTWENW